jgi:PAS domain S-box-containing protein
MNFKWFIYKKEVVTMARAKILITEDESRVAAAIQTWLNRFGYDVTAIASTGMEALQRAAEITETIAAAIFIYRDLNILYANPAAETITGYTQAELLNMELSELIHSDCQEYIKILAGGHQQEETASSRYEVKFLTKQGQERWVDFNVGVLEFDGQIAVLGTAFDITERKQDEIERGRLLAAEREQRVLAETLGEVFLALTTQTNHEAVLDEILRQVQQLVPHSAANIMLLKESELNIVRWRGYQTFGSEELLANLKQSLVDFPIDAEVIQQQQPLIIPDTRQDLRWVTMPASAWIRSFIAIPICLRNKAIGILRLDSDTPHKFSHKNIKYLLPLTNAAAMALENARLYDQLREELTERRQAEERAVELNHKLFAVQYAGATIASSLDLQYVLRTVTQEIIELMEVDGCAIFEWDQMASTISMIAEVGFSGWKRSVDILYDLTNFSSAKRVLVEREAKQVTISQPASDLTKLPHLEMMPIKTLLMLPMECQGRVIGLIELIDIQVERTFTTAEIALAQLLANQTASALENARLYNQAKQEVRDRLLIEKELRWVTAKNQAILNAIPDSMFYLNREGKILDYKITQRLPLSISEKISIGEGLSNIFEMSPEITGLMLHYITQAVDTGNGQIFEYELSLSGDIQKFEMRLVASNSNEVLAIIRDITNRNRAEKALKKSEANLRAIFDNSLQPFVLINRDRHIQAFNKIASQGIKLILGKEIREGHSVYEFIPNGRINEFNDYFDKVLQGETINIETHLDLDPIDKWFEFDLNPVFADDQIIGMCFTAIDVDERKKATDALVASEARLLAEMQSILFTTEALVSNVNLGNLLDFITTQAKHLTNTDGAVILLLSDDKQKLEVVHSYKLKVGSQLTVQGSLAELAIANHKSYISNHTSVDERTTSIQALLQPAKVHSLLCAPLKVRSEVLGVLLVWSRYEQAFIDHDTHLIHLFADQAAIALHNANLRIRSRELAIEQERQRLARDLHDSVTQSLYSIGIVAQASLRRLDKEANIGLRESIEYVHMLSQTALAQIRERLHNLYPTPLTNKTLGEALRQYCDTLSKQHDLTVELVTDSKLRLLTHQRENLYHIAREALWNIVKHASATYAKVILKQEVNQIILLIMDEGQGFVSSTSSIDEMIGLRSMKERAELLGGSFELQSEPGQGTQIIVRIPR